MRAVRIDYVAAPSHDVGASITFLTDVLEGQFTSKLLYPKIFNSFQ